MSKLQKYFDNEIKISSYKLKLLLLQEGIKDHQCENCSMEKWLGEKIPLELHHIDGDSLNNNFSNLQLLCPNCHSLTDNYRAKKQQRKVIKRSLEEIILAIKSSYNSRQALIALGYAAKGANYRRIRDICSLHKVSFREPTVEEQKAEEAIIKERVSKVRKRKSKSGLSQQEAWVASRKVVRPSKEELLKMIWEKSILQISKSMGLCDNSIRKWVKIYNIPAPPVGWWQKLSNGHVEECNKIKSDLFDQFNINWS